MNSPSAIDSCGLMAEATGDAPLIGKLGAIEAARAVERCLTRASRAVEANHGQLLDESGVRMVAWFARGDNSVLAANDICQRVAALPPVSGVSLAVRIGVHAGKIDGQTGTPNDESIKQASDLVALASPRQVLLSGDAVNKMSDNLASHLDSQTQVAVAGEGFELPPFEIKSGALSQRDTQYRTPFNASTVAQEEPAAEAKPVPVSATATRARMMLRYMGQSYLISDLQPVLLAGREDGNDVVITDRRASRHHTRIEWRDGVFMLIDNSTNGTYMVDESGIEIVLRRGECEMPARGRVGLGFSPNEGDADSLMFDIGQR